MKFSLECQVESEAILTEGGRPCNEMGFDCDGRIYIFRADSRGYLASIRVISKAENPERYWSRRDPDAAIPTFAFRSDKELNGSIIKELQLLEGMLAFLTSGSIREVEWGFPTFEYLPETEEERQRARLRNFTLGKRQAKREVPLSRGDLERIVGLRKRYVSLNLYLS
ncbi:MAG TPA: hypothetical protein VN345_15690, partial [Blastocatellia bacterium]|nr:hypothetical protein [Blastocatellia bacterium]